MRREIAILALASFVVLAASTPASAVFAFPSGPTELRAQTCNAEVSSEDSGTFAGSCAGTYPAACPTDKISCNDATAETATTSGNNQFMGINASAYNGSVANCAVITSVRLCYEWWSSSSKIDECSVKVDANGGSSYSTASSTCPGTSSNPGEVCTDVTALESWACTNFFNPSGTRARAFLEAASTSGGSKTLTVDSLYFNVTYAADSTPPAVAVAYPRNATYNSSVTTLNSTASDANLSACWYSLNRGASNASFACNANITGLASVSGINTWTVWANDSFGNANSSTITFSVNQIPVISNATAGPNPIAGSTAITIYANTTANGVNDSERNTLNLYCGDTSTPTASNTNCTSGTTSSAYPYALSCSFTSENASGNYAKYCRVYDGNSYSPAVAANYTVNTTPLTTAIVSVAGDTAPSYFDTANDGVTNIIVSGETGMTCRWGSSDLAYSSMGNSCTISGVQANCSVNDATSQGLTTRYVSCQNALGIAQNSTNNLDVPFYLDYTPPTTFDNSNSSVNAPPYTVNITESDNVDGNPTTLYCTDTAGTCTPSTSIDNGGTATFTSSNRGRNYFRYFSTDFAGNVQATQNKTININQLPTFTSASDNAATIRGGASVTINTTTSDPDAGQNIRLFICNAPSASPTGCSATQYCTTVGNANLSCTFASEPDTANHTWYAYLFDELGEPANANPLTGNYATDSTPPAITVTSPANATYNSNGIALTINTSEAASAAWYSLDATANQTLTNTTPTNWNAALTNLPDGTHNITIYANDSTGNAATTPTIHFTIDSTPPAITILSPANASYRTTAITINITSNEALSWAGYRINGGALTNLTNATTTNWNAALTNLPDGTHNITINANDSTGNTATTPTIHFTIDSTPPAITILSPANASYRTTAITINITSNEALSWAGYRINGGALTNLTNATTTNWNANLTNLPDGTHNITIYANDSTGNAATTPTIHFTIDTTPPAITITSPANASYKTATSLTLNITTNEDTTSATYSLNNGPTTSLTNGSMRNWTATLANLPAESTNTLTIRANDTANNQGNATITFYADSLAPRFYGPAALPNPANETQSVKCTIFWNDTFTLTNVTISENETLGGTFQNHLINLTATGYANYTLANTAKGNYACAFYATDAAGNANSTEINFTVREVAGASPAIPSGPNDGVGAVGGGFAYGERGGTVAGNAVAKTVAHSAVIEKVSGKEGSFDIEVYNGDANSSLKDLTLEITGRLQDFVTTTPGSISLIRPGERGRFKVRLNVPSGEENTGGQDALKAVITGKLFSQSAEMDYVETRDITLVLEQAGRNEGSLGLSKAEKAVSEMQAAGFNASEAKRLLAEAGLKLSKGKRYDAEILSQKAIGIKLKAFEANDLIRSVAESLVRPENRLQPSGNPSAGISRSNLRGNVRDAPLTGLLLEQTTAGGEAATKLLGLAIAAFEKGDYDAAYALATSAKASLPPEKLDDAGQLPFGKYWPYSLFAALAVLSIGGFLAYRARQKSSKGRRIERMEWEEDDLKTRLSSSLRDYIMGELSEGEYHRSTERQRAKLETIRRQRLILANEKVSLLEPPKVLKRLGIGRRAAEPEV